MLNTIIEELAIKTLDEQPDGNEEYSDLIKLIRNQLPSAYKSLIYELEAMLTKQQYESELRMFKEGFKMGLNMGVKSIL